MSSPSLSVIIPCYNSKDTLEMAVESCFSQGLNSFEIILVDDGSTDGTKSVMETLAARHPEIHLFFHEQNQGGGAARNTAVSHASSDVIFCLDSDDALPPNTLSTMLSFMKEKRCDAVGIHHSIKFNGTDINDIDHVDSFGYAGQHIPFESLLQKDGVLCPLYSTFMHTKASFVAAGGYPTTHGFDTQAFAWRFLTSGNIAYTCPNASYLHRIHYKASYYIREAEQGKVNYNWRDIFLDHFTLFDDETQNFIKTFNCSDFTQNIFDELRKRKVVFRENYQEYFGKDQKIELADKRVYIARNSLHGTYLRIKRRVVRYIGLALVIARAREWRIDLLYAFTLLRVKKLLHTGFDTNNEQGEEIDIVIPTVSKDFNLLSLSIESLRKNVSHPINKIYIISKEDAMIKDFCTQNNCVFIDEQKLIGYSPKNIHYQVGEKNRAGWIFQQLLKLSGDTFTEKEHYLVVDSDTVLIRPHLFIKNDVYHFFQSEEYYFPYFRTFKKLFGYEVKSKLSLTCHMMIFNRSMLKEMKKQMEELSKMSWDKAYLSTIDQNELSCVSDYDNYANWVHVNYPKKVSFSPFYNTALGRNEIATLSDLEKKYSKKYKSLSFHHYHE